jgi:hypothetical protein
MDVGEKRYVDDPNIKDMNKEELLEMIRNEIHSLAFETLRTNAQEKKDKKNRIFKPKGLSEEDIEHSLFYGGNKPKEMSMKDITTIREGYENGLPQLTSTEIIAFEDGFEEMLKEIDGASVVFDPQSNGYSFKAWVGPDGIEAGASGVVEMGNKGSVKWAYSMKNGLTISTEDLGVEQGNKRLMEKLYNHYDEWQKEWREKLTIQPGQETDEPEAAPEEAGGEEAAPAPEEAPADAGGGEEAGMDDSLV